jgi:hypothetical protein
MGTGECNSYSFITVHMKLYFQPTSIISKKHKEAYDVTLLSVCP